VPPITPDAQLIHYAMGVNLMRKMEKIRQVFVSAAKNISAGNLSAAPMDGI